MRSTFLSHSELDLFIVPVTETEICHLALLVYNFRHFVGPTEVLLPPCISTPKGAPNSPTMTSPPTRHQRGALRLIRWPLVQTVCRSLLCRPSLHLVLLFCSPAAKRNFVPVPKHYAITTPTAVYADL